MTASRHSRTVSTSSTGRIRNDRLGPPNGEDSAVWGACHRAGLVELRIEGYMPALAPADADWTDAEVEEYFRRRERIQLDRLDGLSDGEVRTREVHGFSRQELAELRDLTARYSARLKVDPTAARTTMHVSVVPMARITASGPENSAWTGENIRPNGSPSG